jgi:endonuclease/exonuclease/phosphatase family metal-dependent hydrolase
VTAPPVTGRALAPAVLLMATATTLMLEATRVFVAYLVFVVDQSNRLQLGVIATAVFAATGLGGLLLRRAGWRLAIVVAAGGLALARGVLQLWAQPDARIVLGAAVVIGWGWLAIALFSWLRDAAAFGLVLGLGLDVAIRIAFRTVDLPWMPGAAAHLAALLVVAGCVASAALVARRTPGAPAARAPVLSLVAIGPGLVVFHLMTGNLGLAQALLDVGFAAAAALMALGVGIGLALVALELLGRRLPGGASWRLPARVEGPLSIAVLAAVVLLAGWLFWSRAPLTGAGFVAGVAASIVLLALATLSGRPREDGAQRGVVLPFVGGMLLQVALLFAYYSFTGAPLVIVIAWLLLLAIALQAVSPPAGEVDWRLPAAGAPVAAVVLLLVLACGWAWLAEDNPAAGPALGAELTVMTYNIQNGFARDNRFSLDEQARVIEASGADIVILNEVSRGWLVAAGIDQARWLSERLEMPFVFGPASGDDLWGNVILSRAPLSDIERHRYESSQNLQRGAIEAHVATEAGALLVLGTHLDNPSGAGAVRLDQANQLIGFRAGRAPAVVAGDLNADPDSDVLLALRDSGLVDAGAAANVPTSEDGRRIDYILTTPDITNMETRTGEAWTSDHLPVVARLRLGP